MAEVCLAFPTGRCNCTEGLPQLPEDPRHWMCPPTTTPELPTNMTTTELPTTPNMTVTSITPEVVTSSTSLSVTSTMSTMTTLSSTWNTSTEIGSTTTIMTSVTSSMPTDESNDALIVGLSVGFTLLVIFIGTAVVLLVLRHRKKRRSEQDDKEGLPVNDGDETDGKPTGQGKDNVVTKDGSTAQNGTEVKQHEPKKIDVKPDQGGSATSPKPTDGAGSDSNQGHGEVQTTSL